MLTSTTTRSRRRSGAVAVTFALSLSPVFLPSAVAVAESPAVAVIGLARGDSGDAVRQLQIALVGEGVMNTRGVDGRFGTGTEAALKELQRREGLHATGKVDEATAVALGLSSNPYHGLVRGDRGSDVAALQDQLTFAGVDVGDDEVGEFGSGTERAVRTFQRRVGYAETGRVNAATAVALVGATSAPVDVVEAAPVAEPSPEASPAPDPAEAAAPAPSVEQTQVAEDSTVAPEDAPLVGLRMGARGEPVKALQRLLMGHGFNVIGGADGIFGVLTANALRSFQFAKDLPETAVVDEATAEALRGELTAVSAESPAAPASSETSVGDSTAPVAPESGSEPAAAPLSPFEGLQFGSVGADVRALQSALMEAGVTVIGGADGRFGRMTEAAVKEFQDRHGLDRTGRVDRATAAALSGEQTAAPTNHLVGLAAGAIGQTVVELQRALMSHGITVRGGADGIFGPATAGAVKDFQRSRGLEATGRVDQATADALSTPTPQPVRGDTGGDASTNDEGERHDDDHDHDHGGDVGWPNYGERGARVSALQQALVDAGVPLRGGVDGVFGGATSAAVMEFQRRNDIAVTGRVDNATAIALGLTEEAAPLPPDSSSVVLEVFPMQGPCSFTDTWGAPRSGGRSHEGTDIIASEGNLLYAVADGTITKIYVDRIGGLAGNGIRLTMDDGTYFFYAHMTEVAPGLSVGDRVEAGDVVGFNGETGNAGTPHLHFEIHPNGGAAVNPYPFLKPIDACHITEPRG